jgi:hypothetical protein
MATPTTVAALPPPQQIARGLAGGVPAELSKSPLLGILGVIIGTGIVTLTGRMLTLGLADLRVTSESVSTAVPGSAAPITWP